MKKNRFALLAATAVVAFGMIVTGCGDDKADTSNNTTNTDTQKDTAQTPAASTGDEQVIHVTAKNFAWTLDKTEVKKGQPVKLIVTADEGMHGLTIDGTNVKDVHAMNGKEDTVTFTPDKAGDLTLRCSIMCGTGHAEMKQTLKVTE